MQETVQGIRIVKAFTLEDVMRAALRRQRRRRSSRKPTRWRASPTAPAADGDPRRLCPAVALSTAATGSSRSGVAPAQFFSFISAFLLAYEPAKRLARLNIDLTAIWSASASCSRLSTARRPSRSTTIGRSSCSTSARIEFFRVEFAYRPGDPVIRDLSFVADPAQLTALVGRSGGGKSTILNLILRFYERSGGVIPIDGQDVATVRAGRCASRSPMWARTSTCSTARSATTSPSASPARPRPRSGRRQGRACA